MQKSESYTVSGRPRPAWDPSYGSDSAWAVTPGVDALSLEAPSFTGSASSDGIAGSCVSDTILHWQPIVDRSGRDVLYWEALSRFIDDNGKAQPPGERLRLMEQSGKIRDFDHAVISRIVNDLACHPGAVLGVNISTQSLAWDEHWDMIEAQLASAPKIARRLVIEITETGQIPSMSEAVAFCRRFQRLGCKIAIDDFGAGSTTVKALFALEPNIVKIDKSILRWASINERGLNTLCGMTIFLNSLGADIVLEGVESSDDNRLSDLAGLTWRQGYYFGSPSAYRIWRAGPANERRASYA